MIYRSMKEAHPIHEICWWAFSRGISKIEIAFRAYQIYSEERAEIEARQARRKTLVKSKETEESLPPRVGPYSFINLMSFNTKRWELIEYLEKARQTFIPLRKVQ